MPRATSDQRSHRRVGNVGDGRHDFAPTGRDTAREHFDSDALPSSEQVARSHSPGWYEARMARALASRKERDAKLARLKRERDAMLALLLR